MSQSLVSRLTKSQHRVLDVVVAILRWFISQMVTLNKHL